jgi:hypothetical protein
VRAERPSDGPAGPVERPWHRRSGMIHRPSGRGHASLLDWSVDRGDDAPLTPRDSRILAAWLVGVLLVALVVAAIVTYVG